MKLKDILSEEEIEEYHEQWDNYKEKYQPNSPYNVHSEIPVISKVFQYKGRLVFRAHVFQKKLRKTNPYFISEKYHHPFWHAQHYFTVAEQLFHASSNLIRENSKLVGKDTDIKLKIRKPTFWTSHFGGASVELIIQNLRKQRFNIERENFIFYADNKNEKLAEMSLLAFLQERSYIKEMKSLKEGDMDALERLIRKINWQDIHQKNLYKPRKNLPNKNYLIEQLKKGKIPEPELHNFFSFWDKP